MTRQPTDQAGLQAQYEQALCAYLEAGGEAALMRAYELGRAAARLGLGVLDLMGMHQHGLQAMWSTGHEVLADARSLTERSGEFLAEAVSPFEMALRAYREAARRLGVSSDRASEHGEIHRASEQLRAILDATTALIYLKDAEGRYLFVNRPFEEALGCPSADILGRTDMEVLPAPVARVLCEHDGHALASGAPGEVEETLPLTAGTRTFLALKFPLVDTAGKAYGVCSVSTDITERKEADDALRRAKDALESSNRALESFGYTVAHDLRAPVRRIDGFIEALLEAQPEWTPTGLRYANQVRADARTMIGMIDGLFALSRVARSALHRLPVDLAALAQEVMDSLRLGDPQREARLVTEGDLHVHGDPILLRVVLENLLGNGWKFTARKPVAHLEVSADRSGPEPVYCVRDNGVGFDMAYASRLFVPFQRLHRANDFPGTGIGLATVERIVALHGGRIRAQSAPGQGAAFHFTLTHGDWPRDSARE